jgi:hypothetical protein
MLMHPNRYRIVADDGNARTTADELSGKTIGSAPARIDPFIGPEAVR